MLGVCAPLILGQMQQSERTLPRVFHAQVTVLAAQVSTCNLEFMRAYALSQCKQLRYFETGGQAGASNNYSPPEVISSSWPQRGHASQRPRGWVAGLGHNPVRELTMLPPR